MKTSLKQRIKDYLVQWYECDPNKWIHSGEIEREAMEVGYKGTTAGRRCRELAEAGKIERKVNGKGHAMYRYNPQGDPFAIIMQETKKRYETNQQTS